MRQEGIQVQGNARPGVPTGKLDAYRDEDWSWSWHCSRCGARSMESIKARVDEWADQHRCGSSAGLAP